MFSVFRPSVDRSATLVSVPLSVLSFLSIVTTTSSLLLTTHKFETFKNWSLVFAFFTPELDVRTPEMRFKSKSKVHYAWHTLGLVVQVSVMSLLPSSIIAFYTPVYLTFAALSFLVLNSPSFTHLVSAGLYLLAQTPEVVDALPSIPTIEILPHDWPELTVFTWDDFQFSLTSRTLIHIAWFVFVTVGYAFRGYERLPRHLVSLSWLHLCVLSIRHVAAIENVTVPLAVSVCVILAFTPLNVLVIPAIICAPFAKTSLRVEAIGLVYALTVSLCYFTKRLWPRIRGFVGKLTLMCIVVFIFVQPFNVMFGPPQTLVQPSNLKWETYKNTCMSGERTEAQNVILCARVIGESVKWRGKVTHVGVSDMKNPVRTMINFLPKFLSRTITCALGHGTRVCGGVSSLDRGAEERCRALRSALGSHTCDLEYFDEYTFEIVVKMSDRSWGFSERETNVRLSADDGFKAFVLGLSTGDEIEYTAEISDINTSQLSMFLYEATCVECKNRHTRTHAHYTGLMHALTHSNALKLAKRSVFNFVFGPTLRL